MVMHDDNDGWQMMIMDDNDDTDDDHIACKTGVLLGKWVLGFLCWTTPVLQANDHTNDDTDRIDNKDDTCDKDDDRLDTRTIITLLKSHSMNWRHIPCL